MLDKRKAFINSQVNAMRNAERYYKATGDDSRKWKVYNIVKLFTMAEQEYFALACYDVAL